VATNAVKFVAPAIAFAAATATVPKNRKLGFGRRYCLGFKLMTLFSSKFFKVISDFGEIVQHFE